MIRRILIVLFCLASGTLAAQDQASGPTDQPILRMELDAEEAIPGQQLNLRLTVLVPTFMPDPPEWPSFEMPNLLVRLPEKSTNPTSEKINGSTWAGITRRYRMSPMVPGQFALPAQDIGVTYANPETNAPIQVTLTTDPISFSGTLPEGTEDLNPFLAAADLNLSIDVQGDPMVLTAGQSVKLVISAQVDGTSPMFLPKLLPSIKIDGITLYPDEPVLTESDNRGQVSGSRQESVTLFAEGGGSGQVPDISLEWYNLSSKKVETTTAAGFDVSISGPPAATIPEPRDWRLIALYAVVAAICVGLSILSLRWTRPRLKDWRAKSRATKLASEAHVYHAVQSAIHNRDFAAMRPALDVWSARLPTSHDPLADPRLYNALVEIGHIRYGNPAMVTQDEGPAWQSLASALPKIRQTAKAGHSVQSLPPLNPGTWLLG
jgi:hypothetical protein